MTLGKLRLVLSDFFKTMFPYRLVPNNIDALVSAFMGTNALVDFSRALTMSRAEAVLTLSRAHGIEADFEAAFSGVPVDSNDEEVDLEPFEETATALAEKLLTMLEARERVAKEKRAREAAAQ